MKVLLDECLPLDFRHSFHDYEAHTAEWAGFKGKKNGELLRDAELAGYDVLVTVDQGVVYQQNLVGRKLSIVLIKAKTNQLEDLLPLYDVVSKAIDAIRPGQVVSVPS